MREVWVTLSEVFPTVIPTNYYSQYIPYILILGGIITAFVGKKLIKYAIMLIAGAAFSITIYFVMTKWLGIEWMQSIIISLIAFIVGAFLGWFVVKAIISVIIGLVLGVILSNVLGLSENLIAFIIIVIICTGISYIVAEKVIDLATTFLGSILVFLGIYMVQPTQFGKTIAVMAGAIIFILANYYKIRSKRKES